MVDRRSWVMTLLLDSMPVIASAQTIRGRVIDMATGQVVPSGLTAIEYVHRRPITFPV
jgi:hypothetical protein